MAIEVQLTEKIRELRANSDIYEWDESKTSAWIIIPIIGILGWQTHTKEVEPEYKTKGKQVDFCLHYGDSDRIFIEVKKVSLDLINFQDQLEDYAFSKEAVDLAVLTNGAVWWFYLPRQKGTWEARKFSMLNILKDDLKETSSKLIRFLSKGNVVSKKAKEEAEKALEENRRNDEIQKTLPKAWNKIIGEPDDLLVELLQEETEELCQHKPDEDTVKDFIARISPLIKREDIPGIHKTKRQEPITRSVKGARKGSAKGMRKVDLTGTKPIKYIFKGVESIPKREAWARIHYEILCLMYELHKNEFDSVLDLNTGRRIYFSRDKSDFQDSETGQKYRSDEISDSGILALNQFGANHLVYSKIPKVMRLFNHAGELKIFFEDKNKQLQTLDL